MSKDFNEVPEGFETVQCLTAEELGDFIRNRELEAYNKIAARHEAGSVYIAEISEHRESFKELRVYATVRPAVDGDEDGSWHTVEGFIQCSSLAEVATISGLMLTGLVAVIDRNNLEILETVTY